MSVERQRTRDDGDDFEEEAERFLALEEKIADAHEDAGREADARLDLTPGNIRGGFGRNVRGADVVSAEKSGRKIAIRLAHPGGDGVADRRIPYPDDTADAAEPLVRLCRWDDTPVDRVADLDRVPVVGEGDDVDIFPPAPRPTSVVDVVLPVAGERRVAFESPMSRVKRLGRRLNLAVLATPAVKGRPGDYEVTALRGAVAAIGYPFLLGIAVSALIGAGPGLAVIFLGFLVMYNSLLSLSFGGFDTY